MSDGLDLVCRDELRKGVILDHPTLNGIDYVEYDEFPALPASQRYRLSITFLKAPPTSLTGAHVVLTGGVRITGIRALPGPLGAAPTPANPPHTLFVQLDASGDFSDYLVRVRHPSLDTPLDHAAFSFKAGCPTELDCRSRDDCPEELRPEPSLDYLAKDFQSFRRLLLDLARTRNPRWREAAIPELGTALVELFAYKGDLLSWSQDAVATEAYLETCRLRVSAKRHARLIDHRMHDGRNAWTFALLEATAAGVVPIGTRFLTRILRPLRNAATPPPPLIPTLAEADFDEDPALREATVFEATARTRVDPRLNRLFVHTLGDAECYLPRGSTRALLYGAEASGTGITADRPPLQAGDWLLLEETRGVETGAAADADPLQRRCVRLVAVRTMLTGGGGLVDPAFNAALDGTVDLPALRPIGPGDAAAPRLPLVEVAWHDDQALDIPFCLSAVTKRGDAIRHVSLARGNVVPVDHGLTRELPLPPIPADLPGFSRAATLTLSQGPLTFEAPAEPGVVDGFGRPVAGRHRLGVDVRSCVPAVTLQLTLPGVPQARWTAVPDLLDSSPFDEHFCVEVDDHGLATLRFGDGEHGRATQGATSVVARWRVGTGTAGNVGRDAIAHMVVPDPAEFADPAAPTNPPGAPPGLTAIRQPLAATAGTEPESIAEVRALAAAAMRAVQFRAVTETDWRARALTVPGVADAKATFRWTGSWYTVFVALHPTDPADLVTLPGGRTRLAGRFFARARAALTRVRLAGYDLELDTAVYVPLTLEVRVCVERGHFRGAVLAVVAEALSNRRFADGRVGFFHMSRMRFGEPVRLSRIIATVQAIEGVSSLEVLALHRYWALPNGELEQGFLPLGHFEVARLDNDRSLPENGALVLSAVGGL
jgi:hypothetical protein